MLMTTKRAQERIDAAVAVARTEQANALQLAWQEIQGLRDEIQRLRSDQAGMENELSHAIRVESDFRQVLVDGLVKQVGDLRSGLAEKADASATRGLSAQLGRLRDATAQEGRENADVIQYLLEAPTPVKEVETVVREVVREVETGREMPDLTPLISELHVKIAELQRQQAAEVERLQAAIANQATADVETFANSVAALNRQVAGLEAQIARVQQPQVVYDGPAARGWVRRMG